jgi:succinate dehydrogenase / fumarate reductase flavoprotein subunit
VGAQEGRRQAPAQEIPENERDYYLERRYPAFGNLVPRDIASRAPRKVCDAGKGVGNTGYGGVPGLRRRHRRLGEDVVRDRYGNLFDMYEKITGDDPYRRP